MYKLLIVENDAVIANSIRAHMQSWGYEAVCAEDFREVQKTFLAEQPQLVLMDISLPFIMDIIGVTRYVKFPRCLLFLSPQPPTI